MQIPQKYIEIIKQYDTYFHRQEYKGLCKTLTQAKVIINEEEEDNDVINDFNSRAAICALIFKQSEEALKLTEYLNLNKPGYLLLQAFRGNALKNVGYERRAHDMFTYILNSALDADSLMDSLGVAYSSKFLESGLSSFFFDFVIGKLEELDGDERTLNLLWVIDALIKKAELQQDIEEKQKTFLKVLELTKDSVIVYSSLGEIFFEQQKYELALKCYLKSIEINPNFHYFRHIKASFIYYSTGRIEIAQQFLANYVELDRDLEKFFCIIQYSKQIEKSTQLSEFQKYYQIGVILFFMRSFSTSLIMLQKAKQYDEYNYKLCIFLFIVQRQLGKQKEAIQQLEQLREDKYQNDIYLLSILSELYMEEDSQEDKAEELYLKIIELTPNETFSYYKYVKFLNKINRLDDSLIQIQKAIDINPQKIKLQIMKARIYSSQKQLTKAYETYEEILKIEPNQQCAKYQLSQINYVLNNYRLAFDQMMNIKEGEIGYQDTINILIKIFISNSNELTQEQLEYANTKLRYRLSSHLKTLGDPPKVDKLKDKKTKLKEQQENPQQLNGDGTQDIQEEKEEIDDKKQINRSLNIKSKLNEDGDSQMQDEKGQIQSNENIENEELQSDQMDENEESQNFEEDLSNSYLDNDQIYSQLFGLKENSSNNEKKLKYNLSKSTNKQKNSYKQCLQKIRNEFMKDRIYILSEYKELYVNSQKELKKIKSQVKKQNRLQYFIDNDIDDLLLEDKQKDHDDQILEEQKEQVSEYEGEEIKINNFDEENESKWQDINENQEQTSENINRLENKDYLSSLAPKKVKKISKKKKILRCKSTANLRKYKMTMKQTKQKKQNNNGKTKRSKAQTTKSVNTPLSNNKSQKNQIDKDKQLQKQFTRSTHLRKLSLKQQLKTLKDKKNKTSNSQNRQDSKSRQKTSEKTQQPQIQKRDKTSQSNKQQKKESKNINQIEQRITRQSDKSSKIRQQKDIQANDKQNQKSKQKRMNYQKINKQKQKISTKNNQNNIQLNIKQKTIQNSKSQRIDENNNVSNLCKKKQKNQENKKKQMSGVKVVKKVIKKQPKKELNNLSNKIEKVNKRILRSKKGSKHLYKGLK